MQHPMLAAEGHSRCRIEIRSSGGWDGLPLEKYARKFANAADALVFPHHPQRLADACSISVATVLTIPPKSGNNDAKYRMLRAQARLWSIRGIRGEKLVRRS